MLVDINLLPKKEPRNAASFIIVIFAVVLIIAGGVLFYWKNTQVKQSITKVDNDINITTELLAIEQKKLADVETMDEVEQLEMAVEWTKEQRNDVNFVIRELTKKLPERGFMLSFSLSDDSVSMSTQFDTSSEAAYYLNSLLNTDWIDTANLTGRSTRQLAEDDLAENFTGELMPRYLANFTIKLNVDEIQQLTNPTVAERIKTEDGGDDE